MMERTQIQGQAVQPAAPVGEDQACYATQTKRSRVAPWLIGGTALAVPFALYAGWDWLVAAGLATTIVALAPCLAMCALGLCMGRGRKP
jgi:hypothetical protein